MDRLSKEQRSWNMSQIRAQDTSPELLVRSLLHRSGYRFRLHRRDLPGSPDLVLPKHRVVVFVHGCFWHRHARCRNAAMPQTRREFWKQKFQDNIRRDRRATSQLTKLGWRVLVIWECQTKDIRTLAKHMGAVLPALAENRTVCDPMYGRAKDRRLNWASNCTSRRPSLQTRQTSSSR
jgi:DNA mismatch endonuclease (patch repair protein)